MTDEKKGPEELFPKPPDGYRLATPEERCKILESGMAIQTWQMKMRQIEAEIGEAKAVIQAKQFELKEANSQLAIAIQQSDALNATLKVDRKRGSMHAAGNQIFILEDPAKRLDELPLPAKAPKKSEPQSLEDGGPINVEIKRDAGQGSREKTARDGRIRPCLREGEDRQARRADGR